MRHFLLRSNLLERYALVGLLVIVSLFFAFDPGTRGFSDASNIRNIFSNLAVSAIVAIATMIPLVAGQIDLSVGPVAGLSSVVVGGLMSRSHEPLAVAIVAGIAVGALVGIVNGILVTRFGINAIITTLGTSSVVAAVVLRYSNGASFVTGISSGFVAVGTGNWLGIPKLDYFLVVVALLVWYAVDHTPPGRNLDAVGVSPRAAEVVGLPVRRLLLVSFVSAGLLAGVAGVLLLASQGSSNPQIGPTFTLPAISAAFLGATTIKPGHYNVGGTLVSVILLAVAVDGLTLLGASAWVGDLFDGLALLVAVGAATYFGRRRQRAEAGASRPGARDTQGPGVSGSTPASVSP